MTQHYLDYPEHKVRYDVNQRIAPFAFGSTRLRNLASFNTEEEAIAFIGNLDFCHGDELRVDEEDETSGDSCVVFAAEWDDDVLGGRYLN